jgi:hypothetical protein
MAKSEQKQKEGPQSHCLLPEHTTLPSDLKTSWVYLFFWQCWASYLLGRLKQAPSSFFLQVLDRVSLFLSMPDCFFVFLVELGYELKASHLQSWCCTTWATPPVHFVLFILEMGSHEIFAWAALNHDLPYLSFPNSQYYRCKPLAPSRASHFLPGSALDHDLLTYSSPVARSLTEWGHHTILLVEMRSC